jgi:lysophospholipase L1-like esterase
MNKATLFIRRNTAILAVFLFAAPSLPGADAAVERHYTAEVDKLAAAPAPAPGGILMVGSSIFQRWATCTKDLAPLPVLNRAFGGSIVEDQLYFFDKVVPSSQAALVVWYCGSNHVNLKRPPEAIVKDTRKWVERTQAALPQSHILLVSVIRAPQKREAGLLPQVDAVNAGLKELAASVPNVVYADVNPSLESPTAEPVAGCYVDDHLHLTADAYRRISGVLEPVMEKEWKASPAAK